MRYHVLFFVTLAWTSVQAQERQTENLIIITVDGFRWQELFAGADSSLLFSDKYTPDYSVKEKFWSSSPKLRREKLLPFTWNVMATSGQLYGNRKLGNRVNCTNPFWFSYPGYSEIFTGFVDRKVNSNDKYLNPNATVLEFINHHKEFNGKVVAFSTWDVIPFVLRSNLSGISVNSTKHLDDTVPYKGDALTFHAAFEYLKKEKPRVRYISFDEVDDYAHKGRYDHYLLAAEEFDNRLCEVWEWIQHDDLYKNKTTVLITTDHGRGFTSGRTWRKHGRTYTGSGQIWFMAIGPDTPARGEIKINGQFYQRQFAKTAGAFLGLDYQNVKPVADKIEEMLSSPEFAVRSR